MSRRGARKDPKSLAQPVETAISEADLVVRVGHDLLREVGRCSMEELRRQDQTYDRDSRLGRELLFLIANSEWVRSTVENITVEAAHSIDTNLEVHVDLEEITHEAFWEKDRVWLPLVTIPAGRPEGSPVGDHLQDFPAITVTDAEGGLRSPLPQAVARRQIAAALAEIVVNMAASRWPLAFPDEERHVATREQRLVLSAAILRLLTGGPEPHESTGVPAVLPVSRDSEEAPTPAEEGPPLPPPRRARRGVGPRQQAKDDVTYLLDSYLGLIGIEPETPRRLARSAAPAGVGGTWQLIARTAQVLHAFTDAVHVVVEMSRAQGASALTVHVPARRLESSPGRVRQQATLTIDLLAPSSQTPRDVRVGLPIGLTCQTGEHPGNGGGNLVAGIRVLEPEPLLQLHALMSEILADGTDDRVRLSLTDLALEKVPAVRELFRSHQLVIPGERPGKVVVSDVRPRLDTLQIALAAYADGDEPTVGRADVRKAWLPAEETGENHWLKGDLYRKTTDETLSPRAVHLHVEGVDQAGLRPAPTSAQVSLTVRLSDSPLFSAARYASLMSLLVMLAVLVFATVSKSRDGDAQVLVSALTIFAVIQATRVEYPDRTTLKGWLSSWGYVSVALSVLPTVSLAVGLAFQKPADELSQNPSGDSGLTMIAHLVQALLPWGADRPDVPPVENNTFTLTLGAVAIQLLVVYLLGTSLLYQRPRARPLELKTEPTPDHNRSTPLQSAWWRSTTAEALRLGRTAHAYITWKANDGRSTGLPEWWRAPMAAPAPRGPRGPVVATMLDAAIHVWRGDNPPSRPGAQPAAPTPDAANILSLVQAGTPGRSVTFFVFREEPEASWLEDHEMIAVPLRPDLLAPTVQPVDHVNVFVGMLAGDESVPVHRHPLARMINRAEVAGLAIGDVQLPVPAPADAPPGLQWSRLQISLQAGETPDLATYLAGLATAVTARPSGCRALVVQLGLQLRSRTLVAFDTEPATPVPATPVPASPVPASPGPTGRVPWLPAQRLDIAVGDPEPGETSWLNLAITANARPGVENAVIRWLGEHRPDLTLKGLVTATLHGTSVIFVVVRQRSGAFGPTGVLTRLERELEKAFAGDHLKATGRLHKASDLMYPSGGKQIPLLHVHLRSKDRPGLVAGLVDGVNRVLSEMANSPMTATTPGLTPWYALLTVIEGGTARARFTLRVPERLAEIADWPAEPWETAEQTIRRVISGENGTDPSWRTNLDSTVLNLEIIPDWAAAGPDVAQISGEGEPLGIAESD